ncbi:MAG: methylmalonyl-CoA epimerase [Oligoflexia bacterium]|nr:methylmalonyl-CoA epimerase [Oligoflexia bacterium]
MGAYLDHIGIAIREDSNLAQLLQVLGIELSSEEDVPSEKVKTKWFPLPVKQGNIELLEPLSSDSVIAKFLERHKKDGIHHLSFRVDSINEAMKNCRDKGFDFVYPSAKPGAHNCLVNFIHPKSTGGVLIELTEKL